MSKRIERGVMLVNSKGQGWGRGVNDGQSTFQGWMDLENAEIHDPKYCRRPEDITYVGNPRLSEIREGALVFVERVTTIKVDFIRVRKSS